MKSIRGFVWMTVYGLVSAVSSAWAQPELAKWGLLGTCAPEGTVALFGHPFSRGMLTPGEAVVLKRSDTGAALPTQINPVTSWDDGSVKVAVLAVQAPALEKDAVLECVLVKGGANVRPAWNMELAKVLRGRKATTPS